MINLNECKFGDKLRTESGEMVIFLGKFKQHRDFLLNNDNDKEYTICVCAMQHDTMFTLLEYSEHGWNYCSYSNNINIVGRWEDEK